MEEIWKPIDETFGLYHVSNMGMVRRMAYCRITGGRWGYMKKTYPEFIFINVLSNKNNYLRVRINNKLKSVHRLMAESFIPNATNKPQVNHINGIKTDNRIENLEWVTVSENAIHSIKTGLQTHFHLTGENNPCSKLKKEDVIKIKKLLKSKTCYRISKEMNIKYNTVYDIWKNKTWKHVKIMEEK